MLKGISPLIAAMILVTIAIGIGVGLSGWMTQLVSRSSGSVSTCSLETDYLIDRADFRVSTGILSIKLTNRGNLKLYGFGLILENRTDTIFFNSSASEITISPDINQENKLETGQSAYINVNLSGNSEMGISLKNITVTNDACPDTEASTDSISIS